MALIRRRSKLKWVARLHFWVMFFSFFLYLGLGFALGHEFLYQDIRKKFFVFADDTIVVTAIVPGPPAVPVVTATPACAALVPRVTLDWAEDTGTVTWDIDRDGLPLSTGLTVSGYTDMAVAANTSYTYQVTAYGPMSPGVAISALVSVTTLDCASIAPVTVTIETLGGKNVTPGNRGNTDLSKRRPKVTGTTNTPYAIIDIVVTNPTIRARILANANGYFEWIPPIGLDTGNHILSVTATDPNDANRSGTDSLLFWTKNVSGRAGGKGETPPISVERHDAFDFAITIRNPEKTLFQEEALTVDIVARSGVFPEASIGQSVLNDPTRRDVLRLGSVDPSGAAGTTIESQIPLYLEPGTYRVRVDIMIDGEIISREDAFTLKGLPLLTVAGREVSYAEVASYIGTLFFLLLFLLFFFLLFFIREYWLYLHSLRAITERQLARIGFFGPRKGVTRS
ncbi:MAG: hypothetical protein IPJ68_06260 [Candidatus Moraniibacteriota bacterium]|nr:MAG: hypothetical protein IPJ68_06260 [Candidatus Moranbacteria bacterium]